MQATTIASTDARHDTSERTIPALEVPTLDDMGLGSLACVRWWTTVAFVVRPLAFAAATVATVVAGWSLLAMALAGATYATSLTLVHHCTHASLPMPPALRHVALTIGGALALHSGHAIVQTHLRHHDTGIGSDSHDDNDNDIDNDIEAEIEQRTWAQMPAAALGFRYGLIRWGWAHSAHRAVIAFEVFVHGVALVGAAAAASAGGAWTPAAIAVATLWFADVVFAVLAGKGPQTNWGRPTASPLVRITCRWSRVLLLSHNWHVEHHAYPQLPMNRLGRVADRLYTADVPPATRRAFAGIVDVRLP